MTLKKATTFILTLFLLSNTFLIESVAASDGSYTVGYNILSKYVEFSYGEVKAELTLPSNTSTRQYQWTPGGNATGKLIITCVTPSTYLRYCYPCTCPVDANGVSTCTCVHPFGSCPERFLVWQDSTRFTEVPPGGNVYELAINESDSTTITRNPTIYALLSRRVLSGDNPPYVYRANGTNEGPYPGTLRVNTSEAIKKPYQSRSWVVIGYDSDGDPIYGWSSWSNAGNRLGYFNNKPSNDKTVSVKVYNGRATLPTIPTFRSEIEENLNRNPVKNLWWNSTVMPIEVVRMMYTDNSGGLNAASGSLSNMRAVRGQYNRQFIEQNKADLAWSIKDGRSMLNDYIPDRERSIARNYRTDDAQRAVFASDMSYRDIMFPIKSGYFFNPTGKYTFTLTTELYKRTNGETPEHQHLVNELIKSFRYETNMVFINPDPRDSNFRKAVTIDNRPLDLSGTTYAAERSFITAAGSPLVQVDVNRDYSLINTEPLHRVDHSYTSGDIDAPHNTIGSGYSTDIPDSVTDQRFQRVLEGYTASGTKNSRANYRYTEYVNKNETMFKITESSTVTITINPNNRRLFTHMMMDNGSYYVRALTTDITLGRFDLGDEYQLNNLQNAAPSGKLFGYVLDKIDIGVVGSIFDDMR